MNHSNQKTLLPLTAAVLTSALLFHWFRSTLSNVNWQNDIYHDSFLSLFIGFWQWMGYDSNRNMLAIAQMTVHGLRFLVPLTGVLLFLTLERLLSMERVGMTVLVLGLCACGYPILSFVGLPFFMTHNGALGEFTVVVASMALTISVTAPKRYAGRCVPLSAN